MEFLHANNDPRQHIDSIKVNWYYRPKDIQRKVTDSRQLFATMHSDTCPLTSIRGKCRIMHKADIEDFEEYRKTENSFWYEKMFDRYIHRFYDVVPTRDVRNVPEKVRRVLCERWKYIIVEPARGKELTSELKACVKCSTYCARYAKISLQNWSQILNFSAGCHFGYSVLSKETNLTGKRREGDGFV